MMPTPAAMTNGMLRLNDIVLIICVCVCVGVPWVLEEWAVEQECVDQHSPKSNGPQRDFVSG